uniref:Uncharacterized protein n=1 Tax=Xiphophorus couchianus TaxID=32473 RepID=A0A3B5L1E9_9TELE
MEIEKEMKKATLGHEFGAGAACLKCKDKCEGFELHFWRFRAEEFNVLSKIILITGGKYTCLLCSLISDKFEFSPLHQAVRYIELLPPEKRPVAGTQGAAYRRQQMDRQLPEHDQDPSKCHELSPAEVKQMQQYVRKCKDEALGVGDVLLPEEVAQIQAGGTGAAAAGSGGTPGRSCHHCKKPMLLGEPAVYAERAGYDKLWHPACFVCCTCSELLVDMIYFWKKGKMYCGRHYGDSEKPRCGGCDELIFSNEYTQAEGQNWHLKHFCCFDCDCILAGETYVMENDKPICKPCYMKNYAVRCASCQKAVEPEAQRVSYGEHHWHAEPDCFKCSGCTKCLIGQRFMAVKNCLFCSVECKKKVMT